jgi:hypothetical protein
MWWRRRVPEVVVVTRQGCHLCEDMVRVVSAAAGRVPVATRDLDRELAAGRLEPPVHERWSTLVPVLLVDGREVAHHRTDAGAVRRALRRGGAGASGRSTRRFGDLRGAPIE